MAKPRTLAKDRQRKRKQARAAHARYYQLVADPQMTPVRRVLTMDREFGRGWVTRFHRLFTEGDDDGAEGTR